MIFPDDVLSQALINRDINVIAKGEDIVPVVPTRFFTSECKLDSFVPVGVHLANSWYKGMCDWDVKCVVKAICLLDIKAGGKKADPAKLCCHCRSPPGQILVVS